MDTAGEVLITIRQTFLAQKQLADRAMAQLEDEELHWAPDRECNSIAIIIKHVAGNMKSRWTDFLDTDGEKPDRNRDGEFVDDLGSREAVLNTWERGWERLFATLSELDSGHLTQEVTVAGRPYTVAQALLGQLGHYAQHVGQIVYLAKLQRKEEWDTLSIPRKRTAKG